MMTRLGSGSSRDLFVCGRGSRGCSSHRAETAADGLKSDLGSEVTTIGVSGDPITNQAGLQSFINSMLLSLPIAIALAILISTLVMRSFKFAVTSIVPILLVVAWVYGYMFLVDLAINPITATIAAIAIGVGIDFATHFTVRSREEFEGEPGRFPALRRAGVSTGGALVTSRKGDERTRLLELHPDQWRSTISTPGVAQSRTDAEGVAGCP